MRNSNIVRIDQKGRVLLPKHIRSFLKTDDGTEVVLIPDNDSGHVKVVPLINEKTMELRFVIKDFPGSLATVAETLAKNSIDIIMSESKTLLKGKFAEWDVIVDTSNYNDGVEKIREQLLNNNTIKKMEVLRG
jgi:bifunctional DNA-binding transcriptional regulator/antitoxin component of YhaV-PrlF toxin-antitoxin module